MKIDSHRAVLKTARSYYQSGTRADAKEKHVWSEGDQEIRLAKESGMKRSWR